MNLLVKVNGESIHTKDLNDAVTRYIVQLEEDEELAFEPGPENMKYIKTEVLNNLIERRLLLQIAREKKINVSDAAVEKNVQEIMSAYENAQAWENNLLALGTDSKHLFHEIKEDMILEKLKEILTESAVTFNDEDLENYFNEHKAQMKEPDLYTFYEITVASAEEVREVAFLLEQKKDISDLKKDFKARSMEFNHYTDIPETRLPAELLNVLSDLKEGKTGTLMAGENQLIVYRLIGKRTGKQLEFKNIKNKLKNYLMQQGQKETLDKLLDEEMQKAKIEYIDVSALSLS